MENYYNPNDFDINYKEYVDRFNMHLLEDIGLERNIKSEYQKFKHNAAIAFLELGRIMMGNSSKFSRYNKVFQDDIVGYDNADVSLNPRALAYAYVTSMIFMNDSFQYHEAGARKAILKMNQLIEQEDSFFKETSTADTELVKYFKSAGIDGDNMIRYYRFLQKKYAT
jgi:hypothetical protein